MADYKVYFTLSVLIACRVSANYEYERSKILSHLAYHDVPQSSWSSQYDTYEAASSEMLPRYYDSSYGSSADRSGEHYEGPSERYLSGDGDSGDDKKEASETKDSEKSEVPGFYVPFTNKDFMKYKELASQSEDAHCEEIKVKSVEKEGEPRKGITTCYKCQDPKTKATYERCFYKSQTEKKAASAKKQVCG